MTFLVMGLISAILGAVACYIIMDPPEDIVKHFSTLGKKRAVIPKRDLGPREIIRTGDFWVMWTSFFLVSAAGLMLIGHLMSLTLSRGFNPIEASLAISVFSVTNALGRPPLVGSRISWGGTVGLSQ